MSAVEEALIFQLWRSPLVSLYACSIQDSMLLHPAGLSHHSMNTPPPLPFKFSSHTLSKVRGEGMHDPGGQWPHLWTPSALSLWPQGPVFPSVRTGDCHSPSYRRAFAHTVLSAWSAPCPTLTGGQILQISATQTSQAPTYTSPNTQNFGPQISKLSLKVASQVHFQEFMPARCLLSLRKQYENQTPSQVDCPRPPALDAKPTCP